MGSLQLKLPEHDEIAHRFGACVAEYGFRDRDGVAVLASLYLDRTGLPFELDVWKADFSALLELPTKDDSTALGGS